METNLVFTSDKGNLITSSKLVAGKFNKRHSDVLRAINKLECSSEFQERNFAFVENQLLGAAKEKICIMTRDGFSFLAMGFTGKKAAKFKEDFINAFNTMEKASKNKVSLPNFNNPAEAARAWADEFEQRQLAEKQVKELEPKGLVYDDIVNAVNLLTLSEAAKILGFGRNKFTQTLRDNKLLMRNNLPYQQYINNGMFDVKTHPIKKGSMVANYTQTFVTGEGLTKIKTFLSKH